MEESKDIGPQPSCCSGESGQPTGSNASGACCTCSPGTSQRSWIKAVIAAVVLLSAAGVGAYSLVADRAANPDGSAQGCCESGSSSTITVGLPIEITPGSTRSACCPGGATACDSSSVGGGGCPLPATMPPTGAPNSEAKSKPCCSK